MLFENNQKRILLAAEASDGIETVIAGLYVTS